MTSNVVRTLCVGSLATVLFATYPLSAGAKDKGKFANFGDIKGESIDDVHKDWITILQYDHGVTTSPSPKKTPAAKSNITGMGHVRH